VLDGLGVFDGLPALLWTDDRQVSFGARSKRFTRAGEQPGAFLSLYLLEAPVTTLATITLTDGETWWINRRRAKLSTKEMAGLLGVGDGVYRLWERDAREAPRCELGTITAGEWCSVLRARHGITTRELAELCGIPVSIILDVEANARDAEPLVAWWQRYLRHLHEGYTNPPLPSAPSVGVLRVPSPHGIKDRPRRGPKAPPE